MNGVMGLVMARHRVCGLCGRLLQMTRAHVPPQAAGNSKAVTRHLVRRTWQQEGDDLIPTTEDGHPKEGGMWVFGLCFDCNNFAGRRYDAAYGDFSRQVASWYLTPRRLVVENLPRVRLAPGRVARSMLIGMHALSPQIRTLHPSLAEQLLRGDSTRLPGGLSLHLAGFLGHRAELSGPMLTAQVLGKQSMVNTLATVTFRPLSWALATGDSRRWFDNARWLDVSEWPLYGEDREVGIEWLAKRFPVVSSLPTDISDHSVQLFSDEITPVMRGTIPS